MKLLLDTHILIWWLDPTLSTLSKTAYDAISDSKNLVFVSAATAKNFFFSIVFLLINLFFLKEKVGGK